MTQHQEGARHGSGAPRRLIVTAGIVAVATAVVLGAWLVLRGDDKAVSGVNRPQAASVDTLRTLAGSLGHPIFWAGPRPGFTKELTRTRDGRVYVRYLPRGVDPGDPRPRYLTVGTYPQRNAFAILEAASRQPSNVGFVIPDGGLAMYSRTSPQSVYFVFPRSNYQVEVYDPSARTARRLVRSGQIVPIR